MISSHLKARPAVGLVMRLSLCVTGIQTHNLREDNYQVIHSLFGTS